MPLNLRERIHAAQGVDGTSRGPISPDAHLPEM